MPILERTGYPSEVQTAGPRLAHGTSVFAFTVAVNVCSRGMAGTLDAATLGQLRDENGTSFRDAAAAAGYPSSSVQV